MEISGVTLFVLATVGWLAYDQITQIGGRTSDGIAAAITVALGYVVSILVHEMGHVLAAFSFRIPVARVRLVAWGGYAQLGRVPDTPWTSFFVALAGPVGSAACAIVFFALSHTGDSAAALSPYVLAFRHLAVLNLLMVILNVLPGRPLDGGTMAAALGWAATGRRSGGDTTVAITGVAAGVGLIAFAAFGQGQIGSAYIPPLFLMLMGGTMIWGSRVPVAPTRTRSGGPMVGEVMVPVLGSVVADHPVWAGGGHSGDGYVVAQAGGRPVTVIDTTTLTDLDRDRPAGTLGWRMDQVAHATPDEVAKAVETRRLGTASGLIAVHAAGEIVGVMPPTPH